ncbi:MAG: porin [Pseudolabrys sp.]
MGLAMRIKSFLIGCAGGLLMLTGAQAADLPVKAQPVQYVKICSMYGVGFYYIPGTDMCLRVGGYVRAQAEWGSTQGLPFGSTYNGLYSSSALNSQSLINAQNTRQSDNFQFTGRAMLTADARNQSEYGTIRGYLRIGAILNNADSATFVAERAFIQFAGFTFGQAQSFFDIFSTTELMSYFDAKTSGDTYNYGVKVLAYTAQFGNGFSGTISAELGHYKSVYGVTDGSNAAWNVNGVVTNDTAGFRMPDIVGNLRLDQNWGYVGISGAIHQVAGQYFATGNNERNGHPDDKYGWAASAGGLFYLPWLGARDSIGANFVYSKGAVGYATKAGSWQIAHGDNVGVGWASDGIFDGPGLPVTANTQIHLTNAWSVNAGYEHFWNPRWRTSLYGGYTRVWYDAEIKNDINTHLPGAAGSLRCGVPVAGAVWPPISVGVNDPADSCSPNFSFYQIGSRTQWNVTKDFYMGVDVTYTHLNTAYKGVNSDGSAIYPAVGPKNAATAIDDQSTVSAIFRAQVNFEARNEGTSFVFGQR